MSVQEGVVRVIFRDQTAMVRAGQSWPFQPPAAASAAAALGQSTPFQRPAASALPAPIPSSKSADSPIADPSPSTDDSAAIVPRAREVRQRSIRKVPMKRSEAGENCEASVAEPSPEAAPPNRQAQFELATQLEAKDPVAAIRLYQGLESSPSNWAANALFAHGRLEAARGNGAVARRILTQYLSRFPSGTNVPDARLLLARLE